MADADLLAEFVTEGRDMLDSVEPQLIELQQTFEVTGTVDDEVINSVFRLFHSMKGSAGFLQLKNISSLTHEAETLLDLFRKRKLTMTAEHTDLLCRTLDFLRRLMDRVEEQLSDAGVESETEGLVAELNRAIHGEESGGGVGIEEPKEISSPAATLPPPPPPPSAPRPEMPSEPPPAEEEYKLEITPEMIQRFVQESDELLEDAEQMLLQVQGSPTGAAEEIAAAFRALHSFKGNCGFLGLADLEKISHAMENLLAPMRSGEMEITAANIELLLKMIDVLREGVADLAHQGQGKVDGCDVMIELLKEALPPHLQAAKPAEAVSAPPPPPVSAPPSPSPAQQVEPSAAPKVEAPSAPTPATPPPSPAPAAPKKEAAPQPKAAPAKKPAGTGPHILCVDDEAQNLFMLQTSLSQKNYQVTTIQDPTKVMDFLREAQASAKPVELLVTDISMPGLSGEELIKKVRPLYPELAVMVLTGFGDREMLVRLIEYGVDEYLDKPFAIADLFKKVESGLAKARAKRAARAEEMVPAVKKKAIVTRQDIRVDLQKLDDLINLVGELVIAEAMVTRNPDLQGLELENFERASHHLHRITSDLQDVSMAVRMVPLSATFRKMIRLVHDLSRKAGKQVALELVGEETEVDKTVIEQIGDPLVHIVRNSIDHGLEPPAERIKLGKPETGKITIEARHEGGEVWILITDDGRGLNREKILKRGIERGLIKGDGSDLRDDDIYKLIFEPGFSTADKITDISGRGVGMDVVKKNIEKLKGRVEVKTKAGQGTTVILHIPLTLAIIDGMLVRVGRAIYTLPTLSIRETFKPAPESITVTMDGQEVVRVREELIPVVRLHELYRQPSDAVELKDGILIIVGSQDQAVCLFVDDILGQQEIVIKGLSNFLGTARGISGCTILGNGDISLILDVAGLVEMAQQRGAAALKS